MKMVAPCEVDYSCYRELDSGGVSLGYDRCAVALAVRLAIDPRDPLGELFRRAQWQERRLADQIRKRDEQRHRAEQRQRQYEKKLQQQLRNRYLESIREYEKKLFKSIPALLRTVPPTVCGPPYIGSAAEERAAKRLMTTFQDGPAKGQTLLLHRAPVFLRVTQYENEWDALDQLEDTPTEHETIYVYQRVGKPAWVHINRGRHAGGFYSMAMYKFVEKQPGFWETRGTGAWRAWCRANWGR